MSQDIDFEAPLSFVKQEFMPRGFFITGTDTNVGKTFVASTIARQLVNAGIRPGVYKPVASGCQPNQQGELVTEDGVALWQAASKPLSLAEVCPQCFRAPLAPHLAARAEGRTVDRQLLRTGLRTWTEQFELVLVEGAGGLMSPISDEDLVVDLAREFQFPLVIVAANRLGVINQVLQTVTVAEHLLGPKSVVAIVLNNVTPTASDESCAFNMRELHRLCATIHLTQLSFNSDAFEPALDWPALANRHKKT
jgi:dethiobiotin synthetase